MTTEFEELSFSNFFCIINRNTIPGHNGKAQCFNNLMKWAGLSIPTAQNLSPWINGKRALPQDYVDVIRQKDYIVKVKECMETNVIPYLFNSQDVVNELAFVIAADYKIHKEIKTKFSEYQTEPAYYIAFALYYALTCRKNTPVSVQQSISRAGVRPETITLSVPQTRTPIIGRDTECKWIANTLSTHSLVFLWGVAGIGKSELAKYYINKHKDSFSNTIYIPFNTSIKESIANLNFIGDNPEESTDTRFANHLRYLYTYDSDTIVLLDNFNIVPDDDPDFAALANGNFQLIITSRHKPIDYPQYEIKELSSRNCVELFKMHGPHTITNKQIRKLIEMVSSHTLLIVMIARTLKYTELNYENITNALAIGITETPTRTTIPITKDGKTSSELYHQFLFKLIALTNLTPSQLEVLCILSLMPIDGVSASSAKEYTGQESMNDINYLVQLGYVSWDEVNDSNLSVHPLISEITLKKNIANMPLITRKFMNVFLHSVYKEKHFPDATEQRIGISIFDWITSCETQNYCYVAKDLAGFFLKAGQFYYVTEASKYIETHADILTDNELPYVKALASYYQGTTYAQLANDDLARPHFDNAANYLNNKQNATSDELELYYSAIIESAACITDVNNSINALTQINIPEDILSSHTKNALLGRIYFKLGCKYLLINKLHDAEMFFRMCLDIRVKTFGADSIYVGLVLGNIAFLLQSKKEYSMAAAIYQETFNIFKKHLPENHINLIRVYANLGACYRNLGGLFAEQPSQIYFSLAQRAASIQITKESENPKEKAMKKKFQKIIDSAMRPLLSATPTKLTEINDCANSDIMQQILTTRDLMMPNFPPRPTDQEIEFSNMVQKISNEH